MKYIKIAASEVEGWGVSESLWSQIAPGLPDDVTRYLTAPIIDPDTGDVYFLLDDETGQRVGLDMSKALPGYPPGATKIEDGVEWLSRHPVNTWEPAAPGIPNTWSRVDGTYVVPTGWRYQPGEDVTEDGGTTWFRALQEINHSPSAYPAGYVQIDGPGGEPLPEPTGTPEWKEWDGHNENLYQIGDRVTYHGDTWEATVGNNYWKPDEYGWVKIT